MLFLLMVGLVALALYLGMFAGDYRGGGSQDHDPPLRADPSQCYCPQPGNIPGGNCTDCGGLV